MLLESMNIGSKQFDRPEWKGVRENELSWLLYAHQAPGDRGNWSSGRALFFGIDDVEYSLRASKGGWKNALVLDARIYQCGILIRPRA